MLRQAVALTCCLVGQALADPLYSKMEEDLVQGEQDPEGRLFFTSSGGLSLTNSTVDLGAILAAVLIGLLFFLTIGQNFFGASAGSGSAYGYQRQGESLHNNEFYARSDKRVQDTDLAAQMYLLAEAFKKWEVKDIDCQVYVACEASQVANHDKNGQLARDVYKIMKKMMKHGRHAIEERDVYVAGLTDAFAYGDARAQDPAQNACAALKDTCYKATKKPAATEATY